MIGSSDGKVYESEAAYQMDQPTQAEEPKVTASDSQDNSNEMKSFTKIIPMLQKMGANADFNKMDTFSNNIELRPLIDRNSQLIEELNKIADEVTQARLSKDPDAAISEINKRYRPLAQEWNSTLEAEQRLRDHYLARGRNITLGFGDTPIVSFDSKGRVKRNPEDLTLSNLAIDAGLYDVYSGPKKQ